MANPGMRGPMFQASGPIGAVRKGGGSPADPQTMNAGGGTPFQLPSGFGGGTIYPGGAAPSVGSSPGKMQMHQAVMNNVPPQHPAKIQMHQSILSQNGGAVGGGNKRSQQMFQPVQRPLSGPRNGM